jgi:hypothetical protein
MKNIDKQIMELIQKWDKLPVGYCKGNPVPIEMKIPYHFDYK